MFKVKIKKSSLIVKQTEALATGASKVYHVEFSFDDSWQGLTKSVIFRAGEKSASVLLDGSSCVIPWEVLTQENVGKELLIGVSGWNDDLVTLPTVWNVLEKIQQGAELGEYGLEPSPSVVSEIHKIAKNAEEKAGMAETHAQSAKDARDEATEAVSSAKNYALLSEQKMEIAKEAADMARTASGTAYAHVAEAYREAERAKSYAEQAAVHEDAARLAESTADRYAHEASMSAKEAADAVDAKMGDVESALDAIIAIQESLIGGDNV